MKIIIKAKTKDGLVFAEKEVVIDEAISAKNAFYYTQFLMQEYFDLLGESVPELVNADTGKIITNIMEQ